MRFSSDQQNFSKKTSSSVMANFDDASFSDKSDDAHYSTARVSLAEYALLAALLIVLIAGVIATTSVQIGSEIIALLG